VTPRWLEAAGGALAVFDGRRCRCIGRHRKVAHGLDGEGGFRSAEAANYPREMNAALATAVVDLLCRTDPDDEKQQIAAMLGCGVPSLPQPDLSAREAALRPVQHSLHSVEADAACDAERASAKSKQVMRAGVMVNVTSKQGTLAGFVIPAKRPRGE
jgi:hypothetical protein